MSTKQLFLLVGGVLLLTAGVSLWAAWNSEPPRTKAPDSENKCPDCGRVLPSRSGGECPYCKMMQVAQAAAEGKPVVKETKRAWGASDYFVIALIVFVVTSGGFLIARSMKGLLPRGARQVFLFHRCPFCKRRIRYAAHLAGWKAKCPTCDRTLVLPLKPAKGK